jgi:hypothetical protein
MAIIGLGPRPRNNSNTIDRNDAAEIAATVSPLVVTAIPCGTRWQVKAIGPDVSVNLGLFEGRLPALGAAVLFAEQVGGRVVP